jgi:hypothetical protein
MVLFCGTICTTSAEAYTLSENSVLEVSPMVGANEFNSLFGELGYGLSMLRPKNIIRSLLCWLSELAGY